ncbi:MAG: right-handed parallel beta-helix repeat-containing protein [Kiritimatiellia bacterium]
MKIHLLVIPLLLPLLAVRAAEEPPGPVLALLMDANRHLAENHPDAAKPLLEQVLRDAGAQPHELAEARERLAEIDRLARNLPARDPEASRVRLDLPQKPGVEFHLALNGDDAHPGTAEKPFSTLERARRAVREARTGGKLPAGGATVWIAGGDYRVTETFILEKADGGDGAASPVVYRAARGARPRFTGGVRVRDFQREKDPAVLARIPDAARGNIWTADLRAQGVTDLPPLKLGGFGSGRGFGTHPTPELFRDGAPQHPARWPNSGDLAVAEIRGSTSNVIHGLKGCKEGVFTVDTDRLARWTAEPDAWLYGYWFWDWADSYEKVAAVDPAARLITLEAPFHTYGYRPKQPFHAINLLAELDAPGEWYADRAHGRLHVYSETDPNGACFELSLLTQWFVEMKDVRHVRWAGIEWDLGAADAVKIEGGGDVALAGCVLRRCAGNGVQIQGGEGHLLLSCEVSSMGRGGVLVSGGNRANLAPSGHAVVNCAIHDLSRIDHTYTPGILVNGVGVRVAHNRLHDIPSSAIRLGGNDHVVEFNEVFRVVTESDDQGGVDMWGDPTLRGNVFRFNYWHDIGSKAAAGEAPKLGRAGIRFDDAISGQVVYGNVFERAADGKIGFGAVQIHGGKENLVDNNLFVDCSSALSLSAWQPDRWIKFVEEKMKLAGMDRDLHLRRYPALAEPDARINVNVFTRNLLVRCGEMLRRDKGQTVLAGNLEDKASTASVADLCARPPPPGFRPIPFAEIGTYADPWRSAR